MGSPVPSFLETVLWLSHSPHFDLSLRSRPRNQIDKPYRRRKKRLGRKSRLQRNSFALLCYRKQYRVRSCSFSIDEFNHSRLLSQSRIKRVSHWEPFPIDTVRRQAHGPLYDSYNKDTRSRVDLSDLPLLTDNGTEIPVFKEDGYRVPRRRPFYEDGSCGSLLQLNNIDKLFLSPDHDPELDGYMSEDDDQDISSPTKFYGFPLAFLKDKGHIQANGPLACYRPFIEDINDSIHACPGDSPVRAVAFQGYSLTSHRVRDRRENHDAQLGQVTSAVAGGNLGNNSLSTKALRIRENLEVQGYPHSRFAFKIQSRATPKQFRFETNYIVDMDLVAEDYYHGRYPISHTFSQHHSFNSSLSTLGTSTTTLFVLSVAPVAIPRFSIL